LLHLGHARTFWTAQERARAANGRMLLRNDDLDAARCRPEFVMAMLEDLRWFGLHWEEPMVSQSTRLPLYGAAFERLREARAIYPCTCSRKDVLAAAGAPHEVADEPLYPGTCRPENLPEAERGRRAAWPRENFTWRFRVPDGAPVEFRDERFGSQRSIAGREIGDFPVWRKDGGPSYQLACVVDDAEMGITEVVRGSDLLLSTFRQLLLFHALGLAPPAFYHCPLVTDENGVRLAKRHDALALRTMREQGRTPEQIRAEWK
jgi:glutamyl-tRNA synthetase